MARPTRGKTRMLIPGRDIPWKKVFKHLIDEFQHDAVDDVAATITFYSVAAMFPFLVFMVGLVSKVVSWDTIDDLMRQLSKVAPREVVTIVSDRLVTLKTHPAGGLLTLSFIGVIWASSAGVSSLIPALNRAYDVVETRPFWKRRLLSIVVTLVMGVLSIGLSLIAVAIPALAHWIGGTLGTVIDWLRLPLSGFGMMFVWALLYRYLPNVKPRFQPVTPGSVVGVLLWVGASWGFGQYVQHFGSYEATYGALGGVIVLLLWMWVSTMALLLGAEINKVLMPNEDKEHTATHVTNMPEEAQAQEGDPELNRQGMVHVNAEASAEDAEKHKAVTDKRVDAAPAARPSLSH